MHTPFPPMAGRPDHTASPTPGPQTLLLMGRIGKPHGVRGEVKVIPETDDPGRFEDLDTCYVGPGPENAAPHAVASVRFQQSKHGITVILSLEDVADRDEAAGMRGLLVYAHRDALPPLDDDEFFIYDLIDLDVVTTSGTPVGTIVDVLDLPGHAIYVVARPGRPEAMIPAVPEFIEEVDFDEGRVVIRPIEGLLD